MSSLAPYTTVPTYEKLTEAVQKYLNRYDQDTLDSIPFFINAAEKTILRAVRMPSMETTVGFSLDKIGENLVEGDGLTFIRLPTDYLEMKFVWIDKIVASRVSFDTLVEGEFENEVVWAINSNRMYFKGAKPTDKIFMTYYKDVAELSEGSQSNILLSLVPDAFLYFAVAEGFRFLMEEAKSDYWEQQGTKRILDVMNQVNQAEFSGSPLRIRESNTPLYDY